MRYVMLALLALGACKKKVEKAKPQPTTAVIDAATAAEPMVDEPEPDAVALPKPLPPRDPDGVVGLGLSSEVAVIEAAPDGGWVALCLDPTQNPQARLVVGDGMALTIDRLVATSRRDVVYTHGDQLFHVDVVAHTVRALGPRATAAIDDDSRRIVFARSTKLVVLDPGSPPREVAAGGEAISEVWLEHRRVATFSKGPPPDALAHGGCGRGGDYGSYAVERIGVDLDPTGVEAIERIGPEIGVTPGGEITVDGEVVIDAECGAHVMAAIASPPRVMAQCRRRGIDGMVAGPGFKKLVRGYFGQPPGTGASIADFLVLGKRLVCPGGHSTCIDLLTGEAYDATNKIWIGPLVIVKGDDAELQIRLLPEAADGAVRTHTVKLPRSVRAVSVDAVTGRRITGPAPEPPRFIDAVGRWMLFGRHVIDLQDGVRVTTLGEDALAIDEVGRVLVPASGSKAPLRWRKP